MAEAKRVELTTVGTLKKERKPKDDAPTYRFQLTLGESNEKTCPEYSYSQLVKTVRGSEPTNNGSSALPEDGRGPAANDPFAQEDDDENDKLKAMAQKFEEKYAPKPEKKPWRNKVGRMEDYIDLGMGYDETDPFIDNTDAYDELVPSTLTTKYGGFYINSGKLDFKEVQSESSEDEIEDPSKKRKRRRLKEFDKDNLRRKKKFIKDGREGDFLPKKRGRKPLERVDGKKQPTVADLLQQHKARRQSPQPSSLTQQPQQPPTFSQPHIQATIAAELALVAAGLVGAGELMQRPDGSIQDIIESVVGAVREKESNGMDYAQNTSFSSSSESSDDPTFVPQSGGCPKLPEGLTDDMDEAINQIKIAARKSADGKCKFFSHEVNNILLSIEMMSRDLSCSQRSTVYGHLASHLPCTKETLLKRVKKLRLDQEDGKLREPMRRLKQAIDEIMPGLEETYQARCLVATEGGVKIVQGSSSGEDDEKGKNLDYFFDDESDHSSRDEENLVDGVKLIRKKFQWNDKIRKLLCDVVQIKMKCFEVSKMRTQSAEEYLKYFLQTEVHRLWPKGWMRIRKLIKETRLVHAHLTYRPKRNLLAIKKLLPAVSLLPLGNAALKNAPIDASVTAILDSIPQGAALLKSIQFTGTCTPSPCTPVSTPTSHDISVASSSTASSLVLPRVSITSTTRTATPVPATVREPDHPSVVVTPIPSTAGSKSVQVLTSSASTNLGTSVIQSTTTSATPFSFQASKVPQTQALESPSKLNRAHKSLFDVSVVSAIASGECLPKVSAAGGMSSAKDILSEIINKSLAGFSNSEKLSSTYKYRDSPKFAAFLSKPFSGGSSVAGGNQAKSHVESKTCFSVPKKQAVTQPAIKTELHGGGVSLHKDSERHGVLEKRSSASHIAQDLRTQSRSVTNSGGGTSSSQKTLHTDGYMPVDCLPGKMAVPFHSMYDIQGAISRELQGQNVPSSLSVLSPGGFKVKSRPHTSSPKSSYYATANCDQPLNFSTARQVVSVLPERSGGTSRNITSPQANLNSPQERSRGSSPISPASVRMVNLPHHQSSNKYISSGSPMNDPRSRTPHEQGDYVYLEGIAASFQEYHLKKPQHRSIDVPPQPSNIKSGAGHPDLNNLSPPGHVLVNHNLPKVSSTYSDPIHSISQGCTEIPFLQYPRYILPPTLQGNSSTP